MRYLIRLFTSYDKPRKGNASNSEQMSLMYHYISLGFLTNDEFHALLHDHGIKITDEDYYHLFSKYDKQLRDQFNYADFFRTVINTIMS